MNHHCQAKRSTMINWFQFAIGLFSLGIGAVVYFTDRHPEEIYFIDKLSIPCQAFQYVTPIFGPLGKALPSFIHVYAFILITASLAARKKSGYIIVCLSWLGIDLALELGQRYSPLAVALTPDWFEGILFFENTRWYFQRGTYDSVDMLFIFLGVIAAYGTLQVTRQNNQLQAAPYPEKKSAGQDTG